MPPLFNNRGLFSDHYLSSVVPASEEWGTADDEVPAVRQALGELWAKTQALVTRHEGQTEEHWIRPVFRELGFSFQVQAAIANADGTFRYPDYALFGTDEIRAAAEENAGTPLYFQNALAIADAKVWNAQLDRGASHGPALERRNPNYQIDSYLRETDRRWGILTNGRIWRLYSRETSYRLDSFFEVDLIQLLEAGDDPFKYFWLFFRAAAFRDQPNSFVDRVRVESHEYAESLSASVKSRVYEALGEFVNGFFAYTNNRLDPTKQLADAYSASLILLYRILFALYAEAHGLLPLDNQGYHDTYSLKRIKTELAERLDQNAVLLDTADNYFSDLTNLFSVISDGADQLGVPAYNGGLFSAKRIPFLSQYRIGDRRLARGLDLLARVPSSEGTDVFVDYKTLQVRHLGDIYEGLLEYDAKFAEVDMVALRSGRKEVWTEAADVGVDVDIAAHAPAGTCYLATENGERRATGSYYTPQVVVEDMVNDSVGRLVKDLEGRLSGNNLVDALLALRVCDPAMGSGHFLVEVVDHLARAVVRAGDEATDPAASELLAAKRSVVERCVFGVDFNPLAVELAKLSLWLTTVAHDRPLSFLDAHLLCGNSLVGADLEELSTLGSNDANGQMTFVEDALGRVRPDLLELADQIAIQDSNSIGDIEAKEEMLADLNQIRHAFIHLSDLWTAGRLGVEVTEDDYLQAVTTLTSENGETYAHSSLIEDVNETKNRFRLHHWELAFPEVFLNPTRARGFDAVVTNPPYVSAIERANTHTAEENRFWRGKFASAKGPFDLYLLFMELALSLTRDSGWVSLITPNKFLAAPYARAFREYAVNQHALIRLIDASRVSLFDDPSVYPVISLFSAGSSASMFVEVVRQAADSPVRQLGAHPSDALTRLPECIWAFLLLDDSELLISLAERCSELEGLYGLRAVASTSTDEAARMGSEIKEEHLAATPGWRIVSTGTIAPFSGEWGISRLKHQGNQFLRPVLPFQSSVVSENRHAQYVAPKLIFKKLCMQLEAQLDVDGSYASLNTNFVLPGEVDPFALSSLMHSSLLSWIYEGYFGSLRMGGGYLQVQAPQLRVLPIPALPVSNDNLGAEAQQLYDSLCSLGRTWSALALKRASIREGFSNNLLTLLGLERRRDEDPAFTPPRWGVILAAVESPNADDLAGFWKPLRRTARDLNLDLTSKRKAEILALTQQVRAELIAIHASIAQARAEIDETVFALYGLSDEEIARVRAGHAAPPGMLEP